MILKKNNASCFGIRAIYFTELLQIIHLNECEKLLFGKSLVAKDLSKSQESSAKIPDTLTLILPDKYYEKSTFEPKDFIPGLLTLLAGILTVWINWLISKKLGESTKKILRYNLKKRIPPVNHVLTALKAFRKA